MKCKYCDYENPKDAIVCECCGATLATQRSIAFYKKEAKRKAKDKPRKEKPVKEKEEKTKNHLSAKAVVIISAAILLTAALAAVGVFFWHRAYYEPVFEKYKIYYDYAVPVYDPERGNVYFLMDGKRVPGYVHSESKYSYLNSFDGVSVLYGKLGTKADGGVYSNYVVVSEDGVKVLDIPGVTDKPDGGGCNFEITNDGKYLIIITNTTAPGTGNGIMGIEYRIYYYDIISGGNVNLVEETDKSPYKSITYMDGSKMAYCSLDSSGTYRLTVYDCATGEKNVIYSGKQNVKSRSYDEESSLFVYCTPDSALYAYDPADGKQTCVAEGCYSQDIFINEKYIGYTKIQNDAAYLYSPGTGEHTFIGNNFKVMSVNEDASVIYGYGDANADSDYKSIYSASLGGEVKRLATGADNIIFNGDKTECMFIVEDEIYLSQDGDYPVKVKGTAWQVSSHTTCEESFLGGIFFVYGSGGPSGSSIRCICRLNEAYEFEILSDRYSQSLGRLKDGKTFVFLANGVVYSCTEGKRGAAKKIGYIGDLSFPWNFVSPNGKSTNFLTDAAYFYTEGDRMKLISDKSYNHADFENGVVFIEKKRKYDIFPEKIQSEDETESANAKKEYVNYSLYYSEYGKKKLVMENISSFQVMGDALYVYVPSGKTFEDETLYDVYGGTSVDSLELLISGVVLK